MLKDKRLKAQRRDTQRAFEEDQEEEEIFDGDYSVQSRRSHYGNQGGSMVRRKGRGHSRERPVKDGNYNKMRTSYRDYKETHSMPSQDSESDESGYADSHRRHCQL